MAMLKNEGSGVLVRPERNNFFYGKLMDVTQCEKDHWYFNFKRSLINRLVLGSGVVCGLDVVADAEGRVRIQQGVAIDGLGREIVVPEAVSIDPHKLTDNAGNPVGTEPASGTVAICLAYAETCTDPVPVMVPDCNAPGINCAPSTIREGFLVLVRNAENGAPSPPACRLGEFLIPGNGALHEKLCDRISAPCPEAPPDPCVLLARVNLNNGSIDSCAGRSFVYSNSLLYELVLCLAARVDQLTQQPRNLRYVSGDGQKGTPGEQLANPLIVEVLNGQSQPVSGVLVQFVVDAGGGSVEPMTLNTDPNGRAETRWTLGPSGGDQQVTASAMGTALTVIFRATVVSS